ncbi:hypothetical protein GCM10028805_61120 [Spirosoma harenae]
MRRFVNNILAFVLFSCLLSFFLLGIYIYRNQIKSTDIAAPNLSNSYSYNEKMQFLRNHKFNADVVSIGSSMSLDNLNSTVITQRLSTKSYLNAASWGMSIRDTYYLLKILHDIYPFKTLLVGSNIPDFQTTEKKVNYSVLKDYLTVSNGELYNVYIKTFNLRYYLDNTIIAKIARNYVNFYEYLGFDKYGAINFNRHNLIMSPGRYNEIYIKNKTIAYQYNYLDSIASYCSKNNIKLYFFQSPVRKGSLAKLNEVMINDLKGHTKKVESIVKKHNHQFANGNNRMWEDSLFVDGIHMDAKGSELFTKYCFDQINILAPN